MADSTCVGADDDLTSANEGGEVDAVCKVFADIKPYRMVGDVAAIGIDIEAW